MTDYKNAGGKPTEVMNRRLKMSPGGIITLPVAARKSLGMAKAEGARVTVAVNEQSVTLALAGDKGGFRVSAAGQLELGGEAKAVLESGVQRHYWIKLDDAQKQVTLLPYRS
jgi:hypothetical protein